MLLAMLLAALAAGTVLCGSQAANAQAQPSNPSFNLINRSRLVIEHAYASPAGVSSWGQDRLGNDQVPAGQRYAIRLPADGQCVYDIRVEYVGGTSDERRNVNTCTISDVSFPSGGTQQQAAQPQQPNQATRDPSFRVLNQGRTEVNSVYATPAGVRNWGQDRLGDTTIPAGGNKVIRLPAGQCIYDVRVVFSDGEAIEKRRMDLCQITDLPVH